MRITNCKWKDILRSSIRSSIYLFIWNGLFIPCTHSFRSIAISPRTIRNPSMNKLKSNNFPDKARFDRVKWQKGRLMHESRYSNQEWRVHLQEVEQGTCVRLQWQLCLPGTPITNPPNSIRDLTESRSLWRTPLMLSSLLLPSSKMQVAPSPRRIYKFSIKRWIQKLGCRADTEGTHWVLQYSISDMWWFAKR